MKTFNTYTYHSLLNTEFLMTSKGGLGEEVLRTSLSEKTLEFLVNYFSI